MDYVVRNRRLYQRIFLFFFIFLTIISHSIFGQILDHHQLYQKAERLYNQPNYTIESIYKALEIYQQALPLFQKEGDTLQLADCYFKSGTIYQTLQQYPEALEAYKKSLDLKHGVSGNIDTLCLDEYQLIGDVFQYTNVYDSAEYYYLKAEKSLDQMKGETLRNPLFNSLGVYYLQLGNYHLASKYFDKALKTLHESDQDFLQDQIVYKNNLALANLKLENYEEAINNYHVIISNQIEPPALIFHNLGYAYSEVKEYDSAKYYLNKALSNASIYLELSANNNLGGVFLAQHQLDSARYHFSGSKTINEKKLKFNNYLLLNALSGLANVEKSAGDFDKALELFQQALINVSYDFTTVDVNKNPKDLSKSLLVTELFKILLSKAETFHAYYQKEKKKELLLSAMDSYQDAITVAENIQKGYDSDDAKLFFVNTIYPVFEEAISAAYELYEITEDPQYSQLAFSISEASRASILSEMLKELEIKKIAGVNPDLLREEKNIRQQITRLRLQMAETIDSARNEKYKTELNEYEISFARIVKNLQQNSRYYKLKYQQDDLPLAEIQAGLPSGNALVEYFQGEKQLFTFLLTQKGLVVKKTDLPAGYQETIDDLLAKLYNHRDGQKFMENETLAAMYHLLFSPIAAELKSINRLVIIPDGKLNYLPFETLVEKNGAYLIQNYAISYAYSAQLFKEAIMEKNKSANNNLMAMAPYADKNIFQAGFGPLLFSKDEVNEIGGNVLLSQKATKQEFLRQAGSYGVIHLATHAQANSKDPNNSYIAFYPESDTSKTANRLYTQELYNLRLDSVKLVVLSACESGDGQLVNGEGIISLARAFAYAGCSNIVTTLWRADDKTTSQISTYLHHYLQKGYAKDEALRKAKIDYLQEANTRFKNPFFWANFIFIGDPSPVYERSYLSLIWYGVVGVSVLLILIVILRRNRKEKIYS